MHYLAFDVSKKKLDGVVTNLRTKEEHFRIENTEDAVGAFLEAAPLPKKILAGCEATGGYHLALAKACLARGLAFRVLNPVLTKQFTKATVRKKKTDLTDAVIVAKLLAQGEGRPFSWDPVVEGAKREYRADRLVSRYATGLLLARHADPGNAYLRDALGELQRLRKAEAKRVRDAYAANEEVALIQSVRGVGFRSAFAIWSEIGDVRRFSSAKQLVAYAGLDPRIRQSGHTLNSQGRLTKRGSPHLRHALFMAATCARMHDPELKAYYGKKRAEGKKHTVAVCATARKLIHRIYAVWNRRTPYVPAATA